MSVVSLSESSDSDPLSPTSRFKDVLIGGIDGYSDLANAANFAGALSTGRVSLYTHANGVIDEGGNGLNSAIAAAWAGTGAVTAEFGPYPPTWFDANNGVYNYPTAAYYHFWVDSGLVVDRAVVNVYFDQPTMLADWRAYVDAARKAGIATLAAVSTPNNTGTLYDDTVAGLGTGFFDHKWDTIRAAALYAGGLCIDSPPVFFYNHPVEYRAFIEQEIRWANSMGLWTSVIISPFDSKLDFLSYATRFEADLIAANAIPNSWIIENYDEFQDGTYPTDGTPNYLNPIGSESTPGTIASVAEWFARNAPVSTSLGPGAVRVENANGSLGQTIYYAQDNLEAVTVNSNSLSTYTYSISGALTGTTTYPILGNVQINEFNSTGNNSSFQVSQTVTSAYTGTATQDAIIQTDVFSVVNGGTVVRTVGQGKAYATFAQAMAAAQDGDTISLTPGTYTISPTFFNKNLTIQGDGGMAVLTAADTPADGGALLTSSVGLVVRNVSISGVTTPGGVAAAIRATGGSLTVINSVITDNQAGIIASGGSNITLSVYDTELARNGIADGRGGNILVGPISTLNLVHDWIHDGAATAEVSSAATTTLIEGTRISEEHSVDGPALLLPVGGHISITGSVLQKGAATQEGPLIEVGQMTTETNINISSSTLINDLHLQSGSTSLISATAGGVTITDSTFQGFLGGTDLVSGGSNTGAAISTGLAVSNASPWGVNGAPAITSLTFAKSVAESIPGTLLLHVSETPYHGNAQITLTVDGAPIGGVLTVTADHGAGQTQDLSVTGMFSGGPHTVAVHYVNDLGNRALYVDGMAFNGDDASQSATLIANGTVTLATKPVSNPISMQINLSEITAGEDALAFIAVDGAVQGGPLTVSASHLAGASEPMRFFLDLAPGAHTASVTLLNAAGGGSLYLDSLRVAGTSVVGAAGLVSGTATYAFMVPPPGANNSDLLVTLGAAHTL